MTLAPGRNRHWTSWARACVLYGASWAAWAQVPDAGRMLREAAPPALPQAAQLAPVPSLQPAPAPAGDWETSHPSC
jgi:hypothetical protein